MSTYFRNISKKIENYLWPQGQERAIKQDTKSVNHKMTNSIFAIYHSQKSATHNVFLNLF